MPKIVQFRGTALRDVPKMLRHTADAVERGEYGVASAAVLVLEIGNSADIEVFGFGDIPSTAHTVGLLEAAKIRLVRA